MRRRTLVMVAMSLRLMASNLKWSLVEELMRLGLSASILRRSSLVGEPISLGL